MSNLPPGVTESMIPGNRPEDIWGERIWDGLCNAIQEVCDKLPGLTPIELVCALRDIADEADADPEYFRYQPHPLEKYDFISGDTEEDDEREVAAEEE